MKEVEKALKDVLAAKVSYAKVFGDSTANAVFAPVENQLKYWKEKLEKNIEFDGMTDEEISSLRAIKEAEQQEAIQKELYDRLVQTGHISANIPFQSTITVFDGFASTIGNVDSNDENPDNSEGNEENPDNLE